MHVCNMYWLLITDFQLTAWIQWALLTLKIRSYFQLMDKRQTLEYKKSNCKWQWSSNHCRCCCFFYNRSVSETYILHSHECLTSTIINQYHKTLYRQPGMCRMEIYRYTCVECKNREEWSACVELGVVSSAARDGQGLCVHLYEKATGL